jgi:hypothetical protein
MNAEESGAGGRWERKAAAGKEKKRDGIFFLLFSGGVS